MSFGSPSIGSTIPRVEDEKFLRGQGCFIDDVKIPNRAHGYVVRSPYAHAKIRSVDTTAARGMSGVLAVLTIEDYRADGLGKLPYVYPLAPGWEKITLHNPGRWPLAGDRVRHVGDPVVFVVAESLEQAKDAGEAIHIDFEELPSVTRTGCATSADAPAVWEDCDRNIIFVRSVGNDAEVSEIFADADHIVRDRATISRVTAATIEPRGIVCSYDPASGVTEVHASAQSAFGLRRQLAQDIFAEPEDRFQVVIRDVGGSFGMKGAFFPEYALAAWASRRLARPVQWISDRSESFLSDYHSRDNLNEAEMALDRNGRFLAFRARVTANLGAYPSTMPTGPATSHVGGMAGVYKFQAASVEITGVYTNTNPIGSLRGAGRPEATYVIERLIDKAARELGFDPVALRRQNMITPDELPYRTPFYFKFEKDECGFFEYDSGDFPRVLDRARELSDYDRFHERRLEAESRGKCRGRGVSYFIEMAASPGFEYGEVHASGDGIVTVYCGTANNGQGHDTVFAQVVCGVLGIGADAVRVIESDTSKMPRGSGTSSSRTTTMGGSAVKRAAENLIASGISLAARLLQASEDEVIYSDGCYRYAGGNSSVPLADVAAAAEEKDPGAGGDRAGLNGSYTYTAKAPNWPNGCHICEVEIDPETGIVTVQSYAVVDDPGTVMNHMLLEGQIHGGVAMGLGQILMESIEYDPDSGQLLSGSFADYALPRANDVCDVSVATCSVPTGTNPLGTKGGGESGTIGSLACIMNAVNDALTSIGADPIDMPATANRVWTAINARKA